jgi:hypothetical protein
MNFDGVSKIIRRDDNTKVAEGPEFKIIRREEFTKEDRELQNLMTYGPDTARLDEPYLMGRADFIEGQRAGAQASPATTGLVNALSFGTYPYIAGGAMGLGRGLLADEVTPSSLLESMTTGARQHAGLLSGEMADNPTQLGGGMGIPAMLGAGVGAIPGAMIGGLGMRAALPALGRMWAQTSPLTKMGGAAGIGSAAGGALWQQIKGLLE